MIFVFILGFWSLLLLLYFKDIFSPGFVVSLLWAAILFIYEYWGEDFIPMTPYTRLLFFFWAIFFSISSVIGINSKVTVFNFKYEEPSYSTIHFLYPFIIFVNLCFIFLCFYQLGGGFSLSAFVNIRRNILKPLPPLIKLLYSLNLFSSVYMFVCIYTGTKCLSKRKLFFLCFIMFITFIIKSTKTVFLSSFFSLIFILGYKNILSIKKIFVLSFFLIVFMLGLGLLRGDSGALENFTIGKYVIWYLLAPVEGFNALVKGEIPFSSLTFGGHTFRFFYAILNKLGIYLPDTGYFGPWTYFSFPNNVYTALAPFYVDFGIFGVLFFSSIIGYLFGRIYKKIKRKDVFCMILYSMTLYAVVMQFFSDYIFYALSTNIQYMIYIYILFSKSKWKNYIFKLS